MIHYRGTHTHTHTHVVSFKPTHSFAVRDNITNLNVCHVITVRYEML